MNSIGRYRPAKIEIRKLGVGCYVVFADDFAQTVCFTLWGARWAARRLRRRVNRLSGSEQY